MSSSNIRSWLSTVQASDCILGQRKVSLRKSCASVHTCVLALFVVLAHAPTALADDVGRVLKLLDRGKYREALTAASVGTEQPGPGTAPTSLAELKIMGLRARAALELGLYSESRAQMEALIQVLEPQASTDAVKAVLVDALIDLGRACDELLLGRDASAAFDKAGAAIDSLNTPDELLRARYCYYLSDHVWWYDICREATEQQLPELSLDAIALAEESLSLRRKHFGDRHWDVIRSHAQTGSWHGVHGNAPKAVFHVFAALDMAKEEMPLDHPTLGQIYSDLAALHELFPDPGFSKRELNQLRCLLIEADAYEQTHQFYINNFSLIGQTKLDQGNYRESKQWYEKGLQILSKKPMSRDVAYGIQTHLQGLAKVHAALDELDAAIAALQDAERLVQEQFGPNTLLAIRLRGAIGEHYLDAGDPVKAGRLFQEAVERLARARPEGHAFLADLYQGISRSHTAREDSDRAIGFHLRALAETKKHHGDDSLQAGHEYQYLAHLLESAGKYPEAMDAFETTSDIYRKRLPPGSDEFRAVRHGMAMLSVAQSDFGKARRLLEEQLDTDHKTHGNAHIKTAESKVTLGVLLLRRFNEAEDAELLFEQAVAFYERQFQDDATKARLADALNCLNEALRFRAESAVRRARAIRPTEKPPATKTSSLQPIPGTSHILLQPKIFAG